MADIDMIHRIEGGKDPVRRAHIEAVGGSMDVAPPFLRYRKTVPTYAARMPLPFEVATIEGVMTGKAGDYLACGAAGELYPIDAEVFDATYEPIDG